jgi:hypothetical protein
MDADIRFIPAAFKHGIDEGDIRYALKYPQYEGPLEDDASGDCPFNKPFAGSVSETADSVAGTADSVPETAGMMIPISLMV